MRANTTYDRAKAVADEIAELPHVTGVTFDDSTAHFVSSAALLTVSFDGDENDQDIIDTMNTIRGMTAGPDTYISSEIGQDLLAQIASEMVSVLALAVLVIGAAAFFAVRKKKAAKNKAE